MRLQDLMRWMRHLPVKDSWPTLMLLRRYYAYFGVRRKLRCAARCIEPWNATGQDALQQELEGRHQMGGVQLAQGPISVLATEAVSPYRELQAIATL
jgi:hypothetical protein